MDECKISSLLNPKEEPCTRDDSSGSGSGADWSSTLEELEELLGNGEEEQFVIGSELEWNFMGWEDSFSSSPFHFLKEEGVKQESFVPGFWEQNYSSSSLNLSLNYQEVIDAWSDRGPLVVNFYGDFSVPDANYQSNDYKWVCPFSPFSSMWNENLKAGEVPVMEEEGKEKDRRRARLLKYREKRHNRLFSKKIRYEVRKINAEKRPRMKGRFVKRDPDEMLT